MHELIPLPQRASRLVFGYQRTPHGIAVDDDLAPVVRYVFRLRSIGLTRDEIVLMLSGVYVRHDDKPWRYWHVDCILDSEHLYRGAVRDGTRGRERWSVILLST